jgi:hypothetical protein
LVTVNEKDVGVITTRGLHGQRYSLETKEERGLRSDDDSRANWILPCRCNERLAEDPSTYGSCESGGGFFRRPDPFRSGEVDGGCSDGRDRVDS